MNITKPGGTREQAALADWYDYSSLARGRLAAVVGDQVPSLLTCFDSWAVAVGSFGECELHARALDRSVALEVFEERRPWLSGLVSKRNEAGIATLERLQDVQLPQCSRELAAMRLDRRHVAELLGELDRSFRENLADWEISASDAGKLMKAFTQVSDVVRAEGLAGLGAHLEKRCAELKDARRSADRGTHDNIPWWKFLIIAGIFGWFIAGGLIALFLNGSDPRAAATIYTISYAMVLGGWVALMLFC